MIQSLFKKKILLLIFFSLPAILFAQSDPEIFVPDGSGVGAMVLAILLLSVTFIAAIYLAFKTASLLSQVKKKNNTIHKKSLQQIINSLDENQLDTYLKYDQMKKNSRSGEEKNSSLITLFLLMVSFVFSSPVFAQT